MHIGWMMVLSNPGTLIYYAQSNLLKNRNHLQMSIGSDSSFFTPKFFVNTDNRKGKRGKSKL